MLDHFVEGVPSLLADILNEQRNTTKAVADLAEAVAGLAAVLNRTPAPIPQEVAAVAEKAEKATKSVKQQAAKAIETAQTAAAYAEQKAIKAEPPEAAPAGRAAPADYETTAKAVLALGEKKGRDAAVAILAKFGAKTLKGVPADKLGDVLAACDEALA